MRDVFELLLQASCGAEKIRIALAKRPSFSIKVAMSVLKQRGASQLAIKQLWEICETHQLISLDLMTEPLSSGMADNHQMVLSSSSRQEIIVSQRRRMMVAKEPGYSED